MACGPFLQILQLLFAFHMPSNDFFFRPKNNRFCFCPKTSHRVCMDFVCGISLKDIGVHMFVGDHYISAIDTLFCDFNVSSLIFLNILLEFFDAFLCVERGCKNMLVTLADLFCFFYRWDDSNGPDLLQTIDI